MCASATAETHRRMNCSATHATVWRARPAAAAARCHEKPSAMAAGLGCTSGGASMTTTASETPPSVRIIARALRAHVACVPSLWTIALTSALPSASAALVTILRASDVAPCASGSVLPATSAVDCEGLGSSSMTTPPSMRPGMTATAFAPGASARTRVITTLCARPCRDRARVARESSSRRSARYPSARARPRGDTAGMLADRSSLAMCLSTPSHHVGSPRSRRTRRGTTRPSSRRPSPRPRSSMYARSAASGGPAAVLSYHGGTGSPAA